MIDEDEQDVHRVGDEEPDPEDDEERAHEEAQAQAGVDPELLHPPRVGARSPATGTGDPLRDDQPGSALEA